MLNKGLVIKWKNTIFKAFNKIQGFGINSGIGPIYQNHSDGSIQELYQSLHDYQNIE